MLWDRYTATIIEITHSGDVQNDVLVVSDPEGISDLLEDLAYDQTFTDSNGNTVEFNEEHQLVLKHTKE